MFAIAFDLDTKQTLRTHPRNVPQAYADISAVPHKYGFELSRAAYTCDNEDLGNLFAAITDLKTLEWLPASVRDIRAFCVEQWSDLIPMVKR